MLPSLFEVLTSVLGGEDADQARIVLGVRPTLDLAAELEQFVEGHLGAGVFGCSYVYISVGLTLELRLTDGRSFVLKACRSDADLEHRIGALRVADHLAKAGFPAPAVHVFPQRCGNAQVFVMQALDRGELVQYTPRIRDVLAQEYANLLMMAETMEPAPSLADGGPLQDALWPPPHSVIFDFEGTAGTARWIDDLGTQAKTLLLRAPGKSVIAHGDWSLQNVAIRDGELAGVFDWDSVKRIPEPIAVAGAAAFHSQDWRNGPIAGDADRYPDLPIIRAFIDTYAETRHKPWTVDEQNTIDAALVYSLGYQARCEHALHPDRLGPAAARLRRIAKAVGFTRR